VRETKISTSCTVSPIPTGTATGDSVPTDSPRADRSTVPAGIPASENRPSASVVAPDVPPNPTTELIEAE